MRMTNEPSGVFRFLSLLPNIEYEMQIVGYATAKAKLYVAADDRSHLTDQLVDLPAVAGAAATVRFVTAPAGDTLVGVVFRDSAKVGSSFVISSISVKLLCRSPEALDGDREQRIVKQLRVPAHHALKLRIDYRCPPSTSAIVDGISEDGTVRLQRHLVHTQTKDNISFNTKDEELLTLRLRVENGSVDSVAIDHVEVVESKRRRESTGLTFSERSVTLAIATHPQNADMFKKTFASLVDQADNILVYLNNYRHIPEFLNKPQFSEKVHYILDTASKKGSVSGLTWAHLPGYHVLCEETVAYPTNYVSTLIDAIERRGRKAVVGIQGTILKREVGNGFDPREAVFEIADPLTKETTVHMLNLGTVAFHSDAVVGFDWDLVRSNGSAADEIFAVTARVRNIPLLALQREGGWLHAHEAAAVTVSRNENSDEETESRPSEILMRNSPWPDLT